LLIVFSSFGFMDFSHKIIDLTSQDVDSLKSKKIWSIDCPVPLSRLKKINVDYIDFEGNRKSGELLVFDVLAESVCEIFKSIYEIGFPIEKINPMQNYYGSDDKSMDDNNSSAFNGRRIMNSEKWSSHAYGMAIDINPIQNPYLVANFKSGIIKVLPLEGMNYINRINSHPAMVEKVVNLFLENGFKIWGGTWNDRIDYHHFQLEWKDIMNLSVMELEEGKEYFRNEVLIASE